MNPEMSLGVVVVVALLGTFIPLWALVKYGGLAEALAHLAPERLLPRPDYVGKLEKPLERRGHRTLDAGTLIVQFTDGLLIPIEKYQGLWVTWGCPKLTFLQHAALERFLISLCQKDELAEREAREQSMLEVLVRSTPVD